LPVAPQHSLHIPDIQAVLLTENSVSDDAAVEVLLEPIEQ
jgi:hypothetical protein